MAHTCSTHRLVCQNFLTYIPNNYQLQIHNGKFSQGLVIAKLYSELVIMLNLALFYSMLQNRTGLSIFPHHVFELWLHCVITNLHKMEKSVMLLCLPSVNTALVIL